VTASRADKTRPISGDICPPATVRCVVRFIIRVFQSQYAHPAGMSRKARRPGVYA
jgi:hypothetical protein